MSDVHSTVMVDLSPFAYLKLDEDSGTTAADSSGNSRDGTYYGTYTLDQAGIIPNGPVKCISLNNGDATIPASEFAGITPDITAVTVNVWVQYSGTGLTQVAVNMRAPGNEQLVVGIVNRTNVGRVGFLTALSGQELQTADLGINDDEPHMLTFLLDGTSQKIYVDGVEEASRTAVRSTSTNDVFAKFGRNSTQENSSYTSGQQFVGKLSAPAIFDYALTPVEIESLYENYFLVFSGAVRDKSGVLAVGRGVRAIRETDQVCVSYGVTDALGEYEVEAAIKETGTVTTASASVITDSAQTWTVDEFEDHYGVRMTSGTQSGEWRRITSNTATALTLASALPGTTAADDTFEISALHTLVFSGESDRNALVYSGLMPKEPPE